jgi:hypothetical protein
MNLRQPCRSERLSSTMRCSERRGPSSLQSVRLAAAVAELYTLGVNVPFMITYPDGTAVRVGDEVLMNQGREPGIVHAIIQTADEMTTWGAEEPGLMVDLRPGGLNFWPTHSLAFTDEIRFVSRETA